ncbi:MAG: hypothetical protein RIE08_10225 [Acidimicrobiales bacterium]
MTSRIPALAILLVLSLLASACGGGGDDAATDASPAPTAESSPDPTGGATPETTPDPTSEATPDITPEATPTSPAVGPPPVDPADAEMLEELLPQIPPLSAPPTVDDAAELPNDHLADMFEAVLAAMVQDPPIIDAAVSGAVEERWMPEVVPDLVIRTFAIDQAVTARVMGVIEAWAEAGAAGVYAPDPTTYFATRSAAARNLRQANELAVEILSAALDLPLEDRLCVAESLRTASNECDGPAADLIDPVFDISLSDLELPDDADDDVGDEALCEAWDSAVDSLGLDPATVESIEYAIDDSLADTRFLNRSECRYEADLDEDVEADLDEGYDALENIYAAAIDVVLEAGGVPEDGENGVPLDYDPELLALEARTIFAAAREAALSYQNVDESVARFQLMALVDVGASTAQLQSSWATSTAASLRSAPKRSSAGTSRISPSGRTVIPDSNSSSPKTPLPSRRSPLSMASATRWSGTTSTTCTRTGAMSGWGSPGPIRPSSTQRSRWPSSTSRPSTPTSTCAAARPSPEPPR